MTGAERRRTIALAGLAILARAAAVLVAGGNVILREGTDAHQYDRFARLMLEGWGWVTTPIAIREPLYPALMALAYRLPGPEIGALQALQVMIGAALPVVLYRGLSSIVRERVRCLAAVGAAVGPHFLWLAALPLRENLVAPLVTAHVVLTVRAITLGSRRGLLPATLLLALLVHTDARFLPLAAVVPVQGWILTRSWRSGLRQGGLVAAGLVLLTAPYVVRSSSVMGHPVILTERFLKKWLPRAAGRPDFREGLEGRDERGPDREAWLRGWEEETRARQDAMDTRERELFRSGGRPRIDWPGIYASRCVEYWRFARIRPGYRAYPDGRYAKPWSLRHALVSGASVLPLLTLMPLFWVGAASRERRALGALAAFLLAHALLHVAVHARARYRIPLEALMGVLAASAAVGLLDAVRRSAAGRGPGGGHASAPDVGRSPPRDEEGGPGPRGPGRLCSGDSPRPTCGTPPKDDP